MSLPVYEHTLTVSETTVTPQGPLTCGVSGDERAARLRFCLETADAAAYEYRLETIGGDGAYDLTDRLTPANGELVFDIPSPWTAAGLAAVRLVRSTVADGTETARQYPVGLKVRMFTDTPVRKGCVVKAGVCGKVSELGK